MRARQIQDGGRPPFKKNPIRSPYLRNRLTDFDEILHDDANWPLTGDRPLQFRILKSPRWRRPPSWKITKNRDIPATVWPIFSKFGTIMQNRSLTAPTVKKLIFTNPRWRTAANLKKPLNRHISATAWPFWWNLPQWCKLALCRGRTVEILNLKNQKNHKNRDISTTVWLIFMKFCRLVPNGSLNSSDRQIIWISQIQDGGRPPFWKSVKSPHLCNRLTDFDEIR